MARKRFPVKLLESERGQSTVEYLVVATALMAALLAAPSVSDQLVQTMHNKYDSYAFAVAISDPPSRQADEKIDEVTGRIGEWTDALEKGELPDDVEESIPFGDVIDWFIKKIKDLI